MLNTVNSLGSKSASCGKSAETAGSIAYNSFEFASKNKLFKPAKETAGVLAFNSAPAETAGSIASTGSSSSSSSGSLSIVA